jgi:hypothetical protein
VGAIVRAVLFGLALALISPSARADATPAERETAHTLLASGREKRRGGMLKEALVDFQRAHAIMRLPTTALDLGKTQEALGLLVEARATFLEAARHPTRANESRELKRARAEAKQAAEAIAPRLATLTLSVTRGAHVKLDDAPISASSIGVPLKLNPGKHEIAATQGVEEKRTSVELAEGAAQEVELVFADATPPPTTTAPLSPVSSEAKTSSLVWIGLAVAGAATAVGATTGIVALDIHGDVAGRCEDGVRCPPSTFSDIDRGETFGTVSTIAFVVASLGVGVLVYGLLTPNVDKTSSAKIDWMRGTF